MAATLSVENLLPATKSAPRKIEWLQLLLKAEAWLDDRAGRRSLLRLDDEALADLGLSRADVERVNHPQAG